MNSCLQRLLTAQTEAGEDLRQLVLLYGWRAVVEATRHLLRSRDEARWQSWLDAPAALAADQWREYAAKELQPGYIAHLLSAPVRTLRAAWICCAARRPCPA